VFANKNTTKSMEHVDNALPDKVMIPQPQHAPPVVQMKSHRIHSVFANKTTKESTELAYHNVQ
jgi:hypothetical protein